MKNIQTSLQSKTLLNFDGENIVITVHQKRVQLAAN